MPTAKKYNNQWRCQVYLGTVDGKKKYTSIYGDTKRQAELKALEYTSKKKASAKSNATFVEYARNYINNRNNVLSPASVRKYEGNLKSIENKYAWFATKQVNRITDNDMQKLVNEMSVDYAPKSVQSLYGFAVTCLKSINSFEGINLPRIDDEEIEIPLDNEIDKLMKVVKGTAMEIPCKLGAYCMMRRGEVAALTIEDFDFEKNTISITKNMVKNNKGKWLIKAPKTSSSIRTIPIPKEVADLVKKQGYVTRLNPDKITRFFGNYIKKANLPAYHFHCLRHYCCSVFSLSCPLIYIKYYGGWGVDSKIPERIYQHVKDDKKDEIFTNALSYFDKSTAKNTAKSNKKVAQT